MRDLHTTFQARQEAILTTIRALVEIESPSDDKAAVDRVADLALDLFAHQGGVITRHKQSRAGDHLQVTFDAPNSRKPILLLGHYDSVWPLGTLQTMPCVEKSGKLFGPATFDMKAGIAMLLHAIAALRELRGGLPRPVTVLLVSDEEVGSTTSRVLTEKLAKCHAAVLVLEPSLGPKGALKTARKGVGEYRINVTGVSSHAGVDFQKGHSAVLELARQTQKISTFTNLKQGTTVNPGVVQGGTRSNVVAGKGSLHVDVRVSKLSAVPALDKKFRSLKPFDKKCRIDVEGEINRPPMERSPQIAALFGLARDLSREMGFKLDEASTGGGSDGNFTAALGIPTLDGLGAIGDGPHARHEHIEIASLPWRTALIAGLIENIE